MIHGRPRKNQNSDTLAEYFFRGSNANGDKGDKEIKHFYTNELNIKPCQGCVTYATSLNHGCTVKDDMEEIYSVYKKTIYHYFLDPIVDNVFQKFKRK